MGFIGMMRPHSLIALGPANFRFVTRAGSIKTISGHSLIYHDKLVELFRKQEVMGFYVEFDSKTMVKARAHFPYLSREKVPDEISRICSVRALMDLSQTGKIQKNFLKDLNKEQRLTKYLQNLAGVTKDIAPYALRIGGRPWFLTKGLDRQFIDFLGTWKSPEAAARYFRAAPQEALRLLINFFLTVKM